jgi:hypothetical protein
MASTIQCSLVTTSTHGCQLSPHRIENNLVNENLYRNANSIELGIYILIIVVCSKTEIQHVQVLSSYKGNCNTSADEN